MKRKIQFTKTQLGIYIECTAASDYTTYNLPYLQKLDDSIDLDRFSEAVKKVIRNHPLISARIAEDEDGFACLETGNECVPVIKDLDKGFSGESAKSLVRPFDLNGGELARFEIYRTPEGNYYFQDLHHIIADGTSLGIIAGDLEAAWNNEPLKEETLPAWEIAAAEMRGRTKDTLEEQKAFYGRLLEDAEPDCAPVGDSEETTTVQRWLDVPFELDEAGFKELRNNAGVSTGNFFTLAYGFAVARFSGLTSSVINTVHHGRTLPGMERTVDMCVKTFPFVTDISKDITVKELLGKAQKDISESRGRTVFSFTEIAEEFGVGTDAEFAYQGRVFEFKTVPFSGGESQRIYDDKHIESPKLFAEVYETGNGKYRLHFGYHTDVYTEGFAKCFTAAVIRTAQEFICRERISEIQLVGEAEEKILDGFNNTGFPYDGSLTMVDYFRDAAKRFPDNTAVIYKDLRISYREMDEITDRLAWKLKELGVGKEKSVGVLIPRCEYMVTATLGILKAGGAYLPLDPSYPPERLNFMVKDSAAAVLITTNELSSIISDDYEGVRIMTDDIPGLPFAPPAEGSPDPSDLFVTLYTSGTTGVPKGVQITHGNIAAFRAWVKNDLEIGPDSVVGAYASYGFDAHILDLHLPVGAGAAVCIVPDDMRLDLTAVHKYYGDNKVTHSFMTTQIARQFSTMGNPGSLKVLYCGGEKLVSVEPPEFRFINMYGPTECTVYITSCEITGKKEIPIGKPNGNTKLYITDPFGNRLPACAAGELIAAGPQVARGYLNRPEKNAECFRPNPFSDDPDYSRAYYTGDIVRIGADGDVYFIGRRDAQVKIRGFRIELSEVEEVIRRFEGVKDAVCAAFDDSAGGKFIAAYVVSDKTLDIQEMNAFIASEKPPYMVPAVTMQIEAIPYTQNQKVNKRALPFPERKLEDITPPENELQERIFNVVSDLLGFKDFGVDTDFSMAGLTSIGAVRLNVLLSKEFGVPVTISELKSHNTVRKLEELFASGKEAEEFEVLEDYPLTRTESGILVECLMHPDSTIYNIPYACELDEKVDADKLYEAVVTAFSAHPSVTGRLVRKEDGSIRRMRFTEDPKELEEQIRGRIEMIRDRSFEEMKDSLVEPYEIIGDILFRVKIFDGEKKYFFLDTHHIISDGTSLAILLRDISRVYKGERIQRESFTGYEAELSEERRRRTEEYAEAAGWYKELLSGADVKSLPPRTVNEEKESAGKCVLTHTVPAHVFKKFCDKNGVTMSALMNGAFGFTLGKYLFRDDVTYCTVYNGRSDSRTADTVSMFVKTFPVRCMTGESEKTVDYIKETGRQMMTSMSNDLYSFAETASEYGVNADVLFTYQGDLFEFDELCGYPCRTIQEDLDTSKAPFDIDSVIKDDRIIFTAIYRSDMYDEAFVSGLLESLCRVSESFLSAKELKDVQISREDIAKQYRKLNSTDVPVPFEPLYRMFERQAAEHGSRTAVIAPDGELTYEELNILANRAAHKLAGLGVQQDEIVGLIVPRTTAVFTGELGIMKAGGAFLPMVPEYPDERISYCLKDAGCRFVLTTEKIAEEKKELLKGGDYQVLTFEELTKEEGDENPGLDISPSSLAYCIYTSGSTGTPKGVMIEHRNVRNYFEPAPQNIEAVRYKESCSTMLSVISVSFDFSLLDTQLSLGLGLTCCMAGEEEIHDPLMLSEKITKYGVDAITCTPSFIGNMLEFAQMREALSGIRFYDIGAEAFPPALYDRLKEVSPDAYICNGYGPTEATIGCIAKMLDGSGGITIGRPEANVHAFCLDKEQRMLPVGAMGELVIGGDGVGRGYVNLPEKTAASFIEAYGERMYRTGDLVRFLPDGEIEYFGRLDNQVKLRGFRVELEEIESRILSYPGVKLCKVIVRNNGSEDYLAGFFTSETKADIQDLTSYLKETLTYYMVPAVLMQLDKMPLTVNGKIDAKNLPETAAAAAREYIAPNGRTEEDICRVFAEVLHQERVGATDIFFEIGGTSLTATNVVMRLADRGYPVVYRNIFDYPSPKELAAFLTGEEKKEKIFSDGYDYSRLEKVLAANVRENVDSIKARPLGDIILTGAAGFLGVHVLKSFLDNYEGRVYCVIRRGKYKSPEHRLRNMLMYYFGAPFANEFAERIICIEADITDRESLDKLKTAGAGLVINCAALVKHFVEDDSLKRINVDGVANLTDFCLENEKELIQISTYSVGGMVPEKRKEDRMFENNLQFGQIIDNEYIRTKYLAERIVLEARAEKGLKGRIIRVGNLMSRDSDGEFQINFITNGFMRSLKAYRQLGAYPVTLMHDQTEFSPVDSTARAILALAASESEFSVFHAFNSHTIFMSDVIKALKDYGFDIRVVPQDEFDRILKEALKDDRFRDAVLGIIAYDSGSDEYMYTTEADNRFTSEILYRLGYFWPITDSRYLKSTIEILDGFGFFELD